MTVGVWVPSRIVLISRGRHDEAPASADCYPGMLLQMNSSNQLAPHATSGGKAQMMVAEEDALRGGDITQKLPALDNIPFRRAARGDELLMLLQNGANVTAQTPLQSAGDGTLIAGIADPINPLYEIKAPSTAVTNTTVATTFSNGTYTFPANYFAAGDVVHIRGRVVVSAQNSTNTHQIKVLIGSTTLFDSAALALAATNYVNFDFYVTIRTIGSSGTLVADGISENNPGGTVAVVPVSVASTTVNTTTTEAITVTTTASAASTGNIDALQEFQIDIERVASGNTLCYALEAIDNSGGAGTSPISGFSSAAFIRVILP